MRNSSQAIPTGTNWQAPDAASSAAQLDVARETVDLRDQQLKDVPVSLAGVWLLRAILPAPHGPLAGMSRLLRGPIPCTLPGKDRGVARELLPLPVDAASAEEAAQDQAAPVPEPTVYDSAGVYRALTTRRRPRLPGRGRSDRISPSLAPPPERLGYRR